MKIAIFTDFYEPWAVGGIISSIKAQKTELEKLGHEVTIFCPGVNSRDKSIVTVPVHEKVRINGAMISKRPSLVEEYVLSKFPDFASFDIVHVQYEASCSIAGMRLAKKFNLPLVQTMHGREDIAIATNVPYPLKTLTAGLLNAMHKNCLPHSNKVKRDKFQATSVARVKMWNLMTNHAEQADAVTAPSGHFARKLEHYGVSKHIQPVSNGIDDALTEEPVEERKLEDGGVLKMIWNSRLSKEKRILPFLQALTMLKRPYILYVYGAGNQLKEAKRFAKKHNLKVKFYGEVKREKIFERMKEAHLEVLASYNFDVQPMTLLEAQALGLPVFFCDPAMTEIVPMGSYVFANGPQAAAMQIALDDLPASQINKMSKIMMAHRKDVAQSKQAQKMLKVYKEAIAQHEQAKSIKTS